MSRKRYPPEEIAAVLQALAEGAKISDIVRAFGISETTISRWKAKYRGLGPIDAMRLAEAEERQRFLQHAVSRHEIEFTRPPDDVSSVISRFNRWWDTLCARASVNPHDGFFEESGYHLLELTKNAIAASRHVWVRVSIKSRHTVAAVLDDGAGFWDDLRPLFESKGGGHGFLKALEFATRFILETGGRRYVKVTKEGVSELKESGPSRVVRGTRATIYCRASSRHAQSTIPKMVTHPAVAFSENSLPLTMKVGKLVSLALTGTIPQNPGWEFEDRLLAYLVPCMVKDIDAFRRGSGPRLTEILRKHQLESLDRDLARELLGRIGEIDSELETLTRKRIGFEEGAKLTTVVRRVDKASE